MIHKTFEGGSTGGEEKRHKISLGMALLVKFPLNQLQSPVLSALMAPKRKGAQSTSTLPPAEPGQAQPRACFDPQAGVNQVPPPAFRVAELLNTDCDSSLAAQNLHV